MPPKLGIGITSFNRRPKLETCISRLQELTSQPFSLAANWLAWTRMDGDPVYRHPWRTKDQFQQFRTEMRSAIRRANFSATQRLLLEGRWARWRRTTSRPAASMVL
jgi:hypothetical protein